MGQMRLLADDDLAELLEMYSKQTDNSFEIQKNYDEQRKAIDKNLDFLQLEYGNSDFNFKQEIIELFPQINDVLVLLKGDEGHAELQRVERLLLECFTMCLHHKTHVVIEEKNNGSAITVGTFGWGIRENVKSKQISSIKHIAHIIAYADEACKNLREIGLGVEASYIENLAKSASWLKYIYSPRAFKIDVDVMCFSSTSRGCVSRELVKCPYMVISDSWNSIGLNGVSWRTTHSNSQFNNAVVTQLKNKSAVVNSQLNEILSLKAGNVDVIRKIFAKKLLLGVL